ncbi:hypothetical protein G9417_01655 [Escherichia coli]|uniref:gp53-like domain-containing protein n=1 Tax=Escherichia coli TaxID=562 RepID=UPI0018801895|nr:hypothetical protein [Escherichia coli]MBE8900914.1 hypothetical protein [Escherichia coli]
MSKIVRYQGDVRAFASDAQGMERTVFGGTNQADDLTSQITASFLRGWGIVGASEHPSLEDFNAAMYAMSQFIAYQHQMGVPEWHAEQEYHIGSICTHNGESYQSLQNANIGSQPPSAKWTPVLTSKNGLANLGLGDALIGDECKIAGFDSSNVNAPYMRFARTNTVVRLATKDYAQPKDQTLTDLSGKDKAELRTYLDLKSAAQRDVGSGANQIPDMNDFTSSLTSPGWQKLPSGLIIQWGAANPSSTGEIFITFPVAFSAYPMYVGFGPQQASLPNVVQSPVISAPTITNLGCGVRNLMIPTAGGAPVASMSSFFWIAVGK